MITIRCTELILLSPSLLGEKAVVGVDLLLVNRVDVDVDVVTTKLEALVGKSVFQEEISEVLGVIKTVVKVEDGVGLVIGAIVTEVDIS